MSEDQPELESARSQPAWRGLLDDAAVLAGQPLHDTVAAHDARRSRPDAALVGALVVPDTDLPQVRGTKAPLSVVGTQGAAQLGGPLGLASRLGLDVAAVEITLRDLDDLPGNVRRVVAAADAARDTGELGEQVAVYVELPAPPGAPGWLAAADECAAVGFRLRLPVAATAGAPAPDGATVATWIDAALDREMSYKCVGGLRHAVRHHDRTEHSEQHGVLSLLVATRIALDGGTVAEVAALLDDHYPNDLVAVARTVDLSGARRFLTSVDVAEVEPAVEELRGLGLLD